MQYTLLAIFLWIVAGLAGYGVYGLVTYSDRLDLVASLQADNANMRTKIVFLENNDYTLAIQQLPPIIQHEIALLNEMIYREMIKKYEKSH